MTEDQMRTTDGSAGYLNIGRTRMKELLTPGPDGQPPEIPSFKIGRLRRVRQAALIRK